MKQPDRKDLAAGAGGQADVGVELGAGAGSGGSPIRQRAFELDALRGLALFMMLLHHTIFDLRYLFGLDVFAFQESWWFENLLRPAFLSVFLVVSGICCTFSRSNTRRGLRLLLVAAAFTVGSLVLSLVTGLELLILFNILHVLALGTLLYAGLTRRERANDSGGGCAADSPANDRVQDARISAWLDVLLLSLTVLLLWTGLWLPDLQQMGLGSWLTLPLGVLPDYRPAMADYLPLVPWLGFFLAGALAGRRVYGHCQTAFPGAPAWLRTGSRPLVFIGRNSLWFYALHQPVIFGLLSLLRASGVF